MKLRKSIFCLLLCAAMCLPFLSLRAAADNMISYDSNRGYHDYYTLGHRIRSFLTETPEGELMRFQIRLDETQYTVEYYSKDYKFLRSVEVEPELPVFGGFYATESNYFLLTGQTNKTESPDVECFRVTKYDRNWNRLASAGMYDCNTRTPFMAGSVGFAHAGNTLHIRTCRNMYITSDGLSHQMSIQMKLDTDTMELQQFNLRNISHSFNQFIRAEGDTIVAVDHGDATPRGIALTRYEPVQGSIRLTLTEFQGIRGENYTGASVGDLQISGSSYLVAYNSVLQDEAFRTRNTRNIFVAAVDKESMEVTVRQITHLEEGDWSTATPYLVKLSEDRFLLLWEAGNPVLDFYYTELNGKGEPVGDVHVAKGPHLSDCAPILVDGKVVWYEYHGEDVIFHEIDLKDLSLHHVCESTHLGDITNDGEISSIDYLLVKRYVLGDFLFDEATRFAADVNKDGKVNALDYLLIKRHVLGTYKIK